MIRRPPRSTQSRSSAASDVYKRQARPCAEVAPVAQRRFWDPDEGGNLLDRHQLVVGVGEFSVQGMCCGAHAGSPWFESVGYDWGWFQIEPRTSVKRHRLRPPRHRIPGGASKE